MISFNIRPSFVMATIGLSLFSGSMFLSTSVLKASINAEIGTNQNYYSAMILVIGIFVVTFTAFVKVGRKEPGFDVNLLYFALLAVATCITLFSIWSEVHY